MFGKFYGAKFRCFVCVSLCVCVVMGLVALFKKMKLKCKSSLVAYYANSHDAPWSLLSPKRNVQFRRGRDPGDALHPISRVVASNWCICVSFREIVLNSLHSSYYFRPDR